MQVLKGIHLLGGVGHDSNVYVIDGELVVDAGTGVFFSETRQEIKRLFEPRIKSIIATHNHYDHTGGMRKFRDWTKGEICIHASDSEELENGSGTLADLFDQESRITTVDRTLREGNVFRTENFKFRVLSTPGHTPGSICLYEENRKILISGDTLFEDALGRVDLPGGSEEDMMDTLEKLSELQITYLLPGHGMPKHSGVGFMIKQLARSPKYAEYI